MLKIISLASICVWHLAAPGQWRNNCSPYLFAAEFEYFPRQPVCEIDLHYTIDYSVKTYKESNKRTEGYQYLHNGDNLRGVTDIFAGEVMPGAGWLKTFDFGTFASVIFQVKGDDNPVPRAGFDWTGQLGFIKLFKKKEIGHKTLKKKMGD